MSSLSEEAWISSFEGGLQVSRNILPADSCMVNRQAHDDLMHVQMFHETSLSMEASPKCTVAPKRSCMRAWCERFFLLQALSAICADGAQRAEARPRATAVAAACMHAHIEL